MSATAGTAVPTVAIADASAGVAAGVDAWVAVGLAGNGAADASAAIGAGAEVCEAAGATTAAGAALAGCAVESVGGFEVAVGEETVADVGLTG